MNNRYYYTMFKNEPDVLTVPDVIRLLRIGKNSVYRLIREGAIGSIRQGKKIIVPKVCLIEYLADESNYQILSPTAPENHLKCWTYGKKCDSVGIAREKEGESQRKGA